jgi:hypothetical protein
MLRIFLTSIVLAGLGAVALACDCPACGDNCASCDEHCRTEWVCVPQVVNKGVEVTEWGVVCEPICRPACTHAGCLLDCDTCDHGGCDDACDSPGLGPVGFRPRLKKKLMRKTLVYSIPMVEFVARPCCGCCPDCSAAPADAACAAVDAPQDLGQWPPDQQVAGPGSATTYWINPAAALAAKLPTIMPAAPAAASVGAVPTTLGALPAGVAASIHDPSSPKALNVRWLNPGTEEDAEKAGTMSEALELQAPAPVSSPPKPSSSSASPVTARIEAVRVSDHVSALPKGNRDADNSDSPPQP